MHDEPTMAFAARPGPARATTQTRNHIRELAERTSNGTLTRLLWLQGTRELWVEIRDSDLDVTLVIPAEPERALEAFHHPYAYAAAHHVFVPS